MENAPQPRRGVLALRRELTPDQVAVLLDLPPLDATWPSIYARTKAIAEQFFPRARTLWRRNLTRPGPRPSSRLRVSS